MSQSITLSRMELDALQEVANIGTGHASIAFSALFNEKIALGLPQTKLATIDMFISEFSSTALAKNRHALVGTVSGITKGIEGTIFFISPESSAIRLLNKLKYGDSRASSDVKVVDSAGDSNPSSIPNANASYAFSREDALLLGKFCSILYAKYLTGVAELFEKRITFESPKFISAVEKTLADFVHMRFNAQEEVLLIMMDLSLAKDNIDGTMILLFKVATLRPLIELLNKKLGMS